MPQARLQPRAARHQPRCPPVLPRAPSAGAARPSPRKACSRQGSIRRKMGRGILMLALWCYCAHRTEHAVLFLLLNTWFLKLMVSAEEPEVELVESQELLGGRPQSRGCRRPWWAALASCCLHRRHEGWSQEQRCAPSPKLWGRPGARATLGRLGRLQSQSCVATIFLPLFIFTQNDWN